MSLHNKTALVTAAAQGIGRASLVVVALGTQPIFQ